jgi:hypothetical protein
MEDVGGKGLPMNARGPSMGNFLLVRKTLFKFKWPAGFLMFFGLKTRGRTIYRGNLKQLQLKKKL